MHIGEDRNYGDYAELIYEEIAKMYDYVYQTFDEIVNKMEMIDNKINDYTASTIDKMKHLVSMDESYKGKLTYLVKLIVENKEHETEMCDLILSGKAWLISKQIHPPGFK